MIPKIPLLEPKGKKEPSKHYAVFLRAGVGQQLCILSMDSDLSACTAALFLALQYFPKVHQFEVFRKATKNPDKLDDIGEGICVVPMVNMLKFYSKPMEQLTGIAAPVLAIPVEGKEMGQEDLSGRVREQPATGRMPAAPKKKGGS